MSITINSDVTIFNNEKSARKGFNKVASGHLLYSESYQAWFVDKSKECINTWPRLYKLIEAK